MKNIIKSLKGKKSCGLDWVCGFSLKIVADDLSEELRQNSFWTKWKHTKVLPSYKNKGSRCEAKFYRPISNLSEISKLTERAIYNQVYSYLAQNDLIYEYHHGFLKFCSTSTVLHLLYDIWMKSLDEGQLNAAVFLDLNAGFDFINFDILIAKLKEYGFSAETIAWFESYLYNRKQCV